MKPWRILYWHRARLRKLMQQYDQYEISTEELVGELRRITGVYL